MWNPFRPAPGLATLERLTQPIPTRKEVTVPEDLLPCERQLVLNKPAIVGLDLEFFHAIEEKIGKPARRIAGADIRRFTKKGHLGLQLPLFDVINPFDGPLISISFDAERHIKSEAYDLPPYGGILCGEVSMSPIVEMKTYFHGTMMQKKTPAAHKRFMSDRGSRYRFACYTTIPGFIKPEDRQKIRDAKKVADAVGGEVRLIVETNWTLASESMDPGRKLDPLIVIVRTGKKGESIAYIDRFDCTPAEQRLAQEFAVKP